jgi:hypothetical protein
MMAVSSTTAASAMGSMMTAADLLLQAATQNCSEPDGWPAVSTTHSKTKIYV